MTRRRIQVVVALVIALFGVGLFLPLLHKVRVTASRGQCQNNLHQLGIAVQSWTDGKGSLPPAILRNDRLPPEQSLSWIVGLSPYIESLGLNPDAQWRESESWNSEQNLKLVRMRFRWVNCPNAPESQSIGGFTLTHYVGVLGIGPDSGRSTADDPRAGVFQVDRKVRPQDVKDGAAFTIAIIETGLDNGPWTAGGRPTTRFLDENPQLLGPNGQFGGLHRNCVNVAMLDGSSRTLRLPFDGTKLATLFTIAGGEGDHSIPE